MIVTARAFFFYFQRLALLKERRIHVPYSFAGLLVDPDFSKHTVILLVNSRVLNTK